MDVIKLTHDKLEIGDVMERVSASNCGAVSLFVGTTRNNFDGKRVVSLEYEAHETMAEKVMKEICEETRLKWGTIENIAMFHRLGKVPVRESSVIIAISSPHRLEAQQATQWCIDILKTKVPIWKKEIYDESEAQWKENSECPWSTTKKPNKIIETKPSNNISSHLIQINCTNDELKRRIDTFMLRKREQANIVNVRDFCGPQTDTGCARIDSILMRRKNSSTHLKMQRVYNTYGPYNINKLPYISDGVAQRVTAVETCLDLSKPVAPDIYARLKLIEDRILYLESVSPEYATFWNKNTINSGLTSNEFVTKKRKYGLEDIDRYLFELQEQNHISNKLI